MTFHAVYKVAFQKLHSDTTTISFYWDYNVDERELLDADLTDKEILKSLGITTKIIGLGAIRLLLVGALMSMVYFRCRMEHKGFSIGI